MNNTGNHVPSACQVLEARMKMPNLRQVDNQPAKIQ